MLENKEHLSIEGIEKIINLRDQNKEILPTLTKSSLNCDWIAGFVDAEGCFDIDIYKSKTNTGYAVTLRFRLVQHIRDLELMQSIRNFLKCGTVVSNKDSGGGGVTILVRKLSDITEILVPLFKNHKLHGTKRLDFDDFCKVGVLMSNKEHLSKIGLDKILQIKKFMNTGRK
uniref:LAGLIDADG endonuclease n=1 Tax=Juglanconis juglandina TaxID=1940567 RepID=A0A291LIU3_9PEZI|nr:LAGLIDADG endonuclease [Juglanconis juglandina]